jgi:hypothetical protein
MLAAQLFHRHARLGFLQDVNDLTFCEPRLLHVDHSLLYFAMSFPLLSGTILGDGYHPIPIMPKKPKMISNIMAIASELSEGLEIVL